MDMEQFATVMKALVGCYPQQFDEDRMSSYYLALGDLPHDGFALAAHAAMRDEKYLPTPARLRELVPPPLALAAGIPTIPRASFTPFECAWADLCDGVESPDVERAIAALGGWDACAGRPIPRAAFMAAFNGYPDEARQLAAI
jgi:hypothetical protein